MTGKHNRQPNKPRQILADYRDAIDSFPYRQKIALLHEIEQAETRQSKIELESTLARLALSDEATKLSLSEMPSKIIVEISQMHRPLKSKFSRLKSQFDEIS